jgi:hypothetical protein
MVLFTNDTLEYTVTFQMEQTVRVNDVLQYKQNAKTII